MAQAFNRISDTIVFPPACRERYLRGHEPFAQPFRERDIVGGGVATFVAPYRIERTRPPQHVLLFTTGGVGRYESPQGCGSVRAGEVWIGPAGCPYRYFCRQRWDVVWFHLYDTPRWAGLRGERVGVREAGIIPQLKLAAEGYLCEALHSSGTVNAIARNYAEIIGAYLDRELLDREDARQRHDRQRLARVWDRVHSDLQRRWTVAECAALAHLSPVQFHRIVLRRHGCTPMDVVARLRMQRAEQMLLASECKLDQIAQALGYQTPFAFSRAFKRWSGMSPAPYRERNVAQRRGPPPR